MLALHLTILKNGKWCVATSLPSATYMRQWTGSTSVQVKACRIHENAHENVVYEMVASLSRADELSEDESKFSFS